MDTYSADRKVFFRYLSTRPRFLLGHATTLAAAVLGKAGTRCKLALRSGHRGAKSWPSGLLQARVISCESVPASLLIGALPQYAIVPQPLRQRDAGMAIEKAAVHPDPENYLAGHRWGFLLQSTLEQGGGCHADLERVGGWIDSNADKADAAWEPYSACERVANSLVLLAVQPRQGLPVLVSPSYIDFLCRSLEWIYAHLEYYGEKRTNNHILNDARVLVMGGVALGNAEVVTAGVKLFHMFLPQLISAGGNLRERSSHYQLIVLNWVLDAWSFLRVFGCADARDVALLEDYAFRMADAGALLAFNNGKLCATIGDVSPDFTPDQVSARLSALYPNFWPPRRRIFQPCETKDGWFRLSTTNGTILGSFMEGVYPPDYPTHGHNDLTGFAWIQDATTILTDPGRFRYTPDPISLMQKSAMGHSVPILNGFAPFCETLLPNGQWWPHPYACAMTVITIEQDGIALSHNGFSRATPVRRHVRRISLQGETLEVVDVFEGEGTVDADFCWHFSGAFDSFEEGTMSAFGPGIAVVIALSHIQTRQEIIPILCEAVALRESCSYGEITPSLGVRFKFPLILPAKIMTRFSVSRCAA